MTPLQRWRTYKEHLRFKYAPRLANWIVARSADRAKAKLAPLGRIKVLVDNTVLGHAVTHETAWISTGPKVWGGQPLNTGYLARVAVHPASAQSREYRSIVYLAGIAHLSRAGCIELCTSAELMAERFHQPSGRFLGSGYFDYSIFGDIQMRSLDGIVFPTMAPSFFCLPSSREQQRDRLDALSHDSIYSSLVKHLGKKNDQDAWHIYTAEKHGAFCFLTMDFALIKNVRAQANSPPVKSLNTLVLTPQEFGERFGLRPVPPYLLSYNDASFPVRSDIAMPDGKRRPTKPKDKDGKKGGASG